MACFGLSRILLFGLVVVGEAEEVVVVEGDKEGEKKEGERGKKEECRPTIR